jgi:hypothetical protein
MYIGVLCGDFLGPHSPRMDEVWLGNLICVILGALGGLLFELFLRSEASTV